MRKKKKSVLLSTGLIFMGLLICIVFVIIGQNNYGFWRTILLTKKTVNNSRKIFKYKFKDIIGLPTPIYDLGTFTVNLLGNSGEQKLMIRVEVGLSNNMGLDEINKKLILIQDSLITLLSNKYYKDIANDSGKMSLRTEINEKLNNLLSSEVIINVYFTKFLTS